LQRLQAESYWHRVGGQRVLGVRETDDRPANIFFPDATAMEESRKMAMQETSHVLFPVSRRLGVPQPADMVVTIFAPRLVYVVYVACIFA
jgi:hypothetical protein